MRRTRWDVRIGAAVAVSLILGVVLNVWAIRSDDSRQARLYGPNPLPREICETVETAEHVAGPEIGGANGGRSCLPGGRSPPKWSAHRFPRIQLHRQTNRACGANGFAPHQGKASGHPDGAVPDAQVPSDRLGTGSPTFEPQTPTSNQHSESIRHSGSTQDGDDGAGRRFWTCKG